MMKTEELTLVQEWDKTFPQNDTVEHSKVTFANHFGITLAADLYKPKDGTAPYAAIAVCGPFGAVKEQCSGLYAQEMASRGFLTIAFDPSFTGESGGQPRYMHSIDINTEDFQAAVDYLVCRDDVDSEAIGIIGICGWGGMAMNVAPLDPRIKATVASTMYDMTRVAGKGYFDEADSAEARNEARRALAAQRTADFKAGSYLRAGGVVDPLPEDAPEFLQGYHSYYKTERGYHPRSLNSNEGWNVTSNTAGANAVALQYVEEIENAVMIVHGEAAHSYYMGRDTAARLKGDNKEFVSIPGAVHTDLYDNLDVIPFDTMQAFFEKYLA